MLKYKHAVHDINFNCLCIHVLQAFFDKGNRRGNEPSDPVYLVLQREQARQRG